MKANPDGKPVWEQIDPRELNPAALSGSARAGVSAVSGRVYGGAPRTARGPQSPARKNEPKKERARRSIRFWVMMPDDTGELRIVAREGSRKAAESMARQATRISGKPSTVVESFETFYDWAYENYATPPIRKINEWDVDYNAAYVSPAPRARGPTRISGIHGKKNPVMVLVNSAENPMSVMALLRNGQYFMTVNLDKKEYIDWGDLGSGLKLWEICANRQVAVLAYLTAQSTDPSGIKKYIPTPPGPGGEFMPGTFAKTQFAGRWANDRIVTVGDYDKKLPRGKLREFRNISPGLIPEYNEFIEEADLQIGPDPKRVY